MDSIGAEVGQKMRSAIKAKLMELDCYVDDELPDYIMVMVANRRTKSQMNEDLNLFLSTKTSTFVNWLHIVLKKLKEVTVTNPEIYKKAIKRKSNEAEPDDKNSLKVKKEKGSKKVKNESQCDNRSDGEVQDSKKESSFGSGNIAVSPNKFLDNRKIILSQNRMNRSNDGIVDDNFDIPLLSEVNESINEQELQDIERKIRNVKSRLGLLVESDNEEGAANVKSENGKSSDENERNILASARQISILDNEIAESEDKDGEDPNSTSNTLSQNRDIELEKDIFDQEIGVTPEKAEKKSQHERITFESDPEPVSIKSRLSSRVGSRDRFRDRSRDRSPVKSKRPSVLERLGKRLESPDASRGSDYRLKEDRFSGFSGGDYRKRSPSRDRDRSSRLSDRLGNRDNRRKDSPQERNHSRSRDRSPLKSKDRNKERDMKREGILSRLGVQSKIAVIKKPATVQKSDYEEDEAVIREVQSAIKVKPRVIPSDVAQPNKNLLLKAVADAQRSVAQTPTVGKEVKPEGFFAKKYSEPHTSGIPDQKKSTPRRLPEQGKNKLRDIIKQSSSRMRSRLQLSSDEYDSDGEYTPRSVQKSERDVPRYIPSSKCGSETESRENDSKENGKQQFIITLDGVDKLGLVENIKSRLDTSLKKQSPSPIIFDKARNSASENKPSRPDIPDTLPIVHPPLSVKTKERCRYWPDCRQGDKCEFVHPSESCPMFPMCKFGEKCLFLHPKCKFSSSCAKRDCPYEHATSNSVRSPKVSSVPVQNCKFYPNCTNASCPFYHPKPCKYGKYCENISTCIFSHTFVVSKKNLSWRPK